MNNENINTRKKRLFNMLYENSFTCSDDKIFKLTSGEMSNYYLDSKATTLNPKGMDLIGNIVYEMISNDNVQAIGGLTLGADPIAYSVSLISYQKGKPVSPFIVRKDVKGHGTMKHIEGMVRANDRVIIIDDVITTGKSALEAISRAKDQNLSIVKVISLIDREEGGRENIEREGIPVEAIFTKTQFFDEDKLKNG